MCFISELNRNDSLLSQQMGDVKTIISKQSLKGISEENDIKGEMQPTIIYIKIFCDVTLRLIQPHALFSNLVIALVWIARYKSFFFPTRS